MNKEITNQIIVTHLQDILLSLETDIRTNIQKHQEQVQELNKQVELRDEEIRRLMEKLMWFEQQKQKNQKQQRESKLLKRISLHRINQSRLPALTKTSQSTILLKEIAINSQISSLMLKREPQVEKKQQNREILTMNNSMRLKIKMSSFQESANLSKTTLCEVRKSVQNIEIDLNYIKNIKLSLQNRPIFTSPEKKEAPKRARISSICEINLDKRTLNIKLDHLEGKMSDMLIRQKQNISNYKKCINVVLPVKKINALSKKIK